MWYNDYVRRSIDYCVHVHCYNPLHCCWDMSSLIVSGDFTVTSIMTVVLCPTTASALRGNTVLTVLGLEGCDIDAEGISHLAQALCDITTLRVLNLSGITVGSQGARHLGKLSGGVWGYGLTGNIRLC